MPSRNLFVAVGEVIEGEIKPGMTVAVDLGHLQVTAPVLGLEIVDVDFSEKSYSGLVVGFDEPDELEFWSSLRLGGEVLNIFD